jgi:hypothetical protein
LVSAADVVSEQIALWLSGRVASIIPYARPAGAT